MELREPLNARLSVRLPSGRISDLELLGAGEEEKAKARVKRSSSMLINQSHASPASSNQSSNPGSGSKRFSFMRMSSGVPHLPSPLSFAKLSSIRLESGAFNTIIEDAIKKKTHL